MFGWAFERIQKQGPLGVVRPTSKTKAADVTVPLSYVTKVRLNFTNITQHHITVRRSVKGFFFIS